MKDPLLKYIEEERAISRYKTSLLKKGPDKPYKSRLISLELDFSSYPFEGIEVQDLDELKDAMSLFRSDRASFESRYSKGSLSRSLKASSGQVGLLNRRVDFYERLSKRLLTKVIQEINVIQDMHFKSKLSKMVYTDGVDDILKAEGASLSKERARVQILVYCLGRYIHSCAKRAKEMVVPTGEMDLDSYDKARKYLDGVLYGINSNIFKHYNDGISEAPLLVNGTLGHNNFIHSIYPLLNLFDKYQGRYEITRLLPLDQPFFKKTGKPLKKKYVERGFGLLTPVKRVGNETIELLYMDLWSDSGVMLNQIMSNCFFNHKYNGTYFKAISTKPVWELPRLVDNPYLLRELLALLSLDNKPLVGDIDFSDKSLCFDVNERSDGKIVISPEYSRILVAATRSESDHIKTACSTVDILINQIRNEYESLFNQNRDIKIGRKGMIEKLSKVGE